MHAHMENKDNLLTVLRTLFAWRKLILGTTAVTGAAAAVIVLLLPVYYKATTIFYAASPDLAIPESIFGTAAKAPDYYGTENDVDRILGIARSGELVQFMIDSFDLYARYEIDPDEPLAAYAVQQQFDDLFDVEKTKYDAIELSMEDQDKATAARMANTARERVNQLAQKLIKDSQQKILRTYEENIHRKEAEMTALNDTLQQVRVRFGVYNTDAQAEIFSKLIAEVEGKLNNATAKLAALQSLQYDRDSINLLSANISGYRNELERLQERLHRFNQGMALVDVLTGTQQEASEQLAEDKERYKQTLSAYASDFPALLLLEEASVPVVKSRPKRTLLVVAAAFLAFVFSSLGVVVFDTFRDTDWSSIR
ncbi:MAG: hypothetical protein RLY31_1749 [Bacteroidota bacterium]|jgi:uncharacterized protein involved in exopolysaccharide biosynthesis